MTFSPLNTSYSPLNAETATLPLNVLAGNLKHWLLQLLVSQLAHKFASIVLNNLAVHGLVIRRTLLFDPAFVTCDFVSGRRRLGVGRLLQRRYRDMAVRMPDSVVCIWRESSLKIFYQKKFKHFCGVVIQNKFKKKIFERIQQVIVYVSNDEILDGLCSVSWLATSLLNVFVLQCHQRLCERLSLLINYK